MISRIMLGKRLATLLGELLIRQIALIYNLNFAFYLTIFLITDMTVRLQFRDCTGVLYYARIWLYYNHKRVYE